MTAKQVHLILSNCSWETMVTVLLLAGKTERHRVWINPDCNNRVSWVGHRVKHGHNFTAMTWQKQAVYSNASSFSTPELYIDTHMASKYLEKYCSLWTASSVDHHVLKVSLSFACILKPREWILPKPDPSPTPCFIMTFMLHLGLGFLLGFLYILQLHSWAEMIYSLSERNLNMKCLGIIFLILALFQAACL